MDTIKSKICNTCKVTLPGNMFEKHRRQCRNCRKIAKTEWGRTDKAKERAKKWRNTPHGKLILKKNLLKIRATEKGKLARARRNKKYADSGKVVAVNKVYWAVKTGKIKRENCGRCHSDKNIHAHHEDYEKPLNIVWLCPKCHRQRHQELDRMI